MIYLLPLQKVRTTGLIAVLCLFMISCGSFQQASYYDNDGIYKDDNPAMVEQRVQSQPRNTVQQNPEDNSYSNYFGQKANQFDAILEDEIFTDVDTYSSNGASDNVDQSQLTNYYDNQNDYQGYGGWGDNATNVSVNIYDNGWNNWGGFGLGWGFNDPWLWNGGFGWNNWGWNNWGWRGNRWNRWNNWGWGFNDPWLWNGGFGWNNWGWGGYGGFGWNNWGWGGYYNRGFGFYNRYNNRNYAFNRSRRGIYSRNNVANNALRGRSNLNARGANQRYRNAVGRSNTARSSRNTTIRRSANGRSLGVDQNRAYRTSRSTRATPRYNSSSRSNSRYSGYSQRSNNGNARSNNTSSSRTSTYRSSGSNRSSRNSGNYSSGRSGSRNSSYRSSGSSSRSSRSSSARSSSSSSRSAGSMRSSGGGSSRSSGSRSSGGRSSGRRN